MAVSITPNFGLNQLFSQQASGNRASSQIGSSKSDPEWNVTPESGPSSTSQFADAFSAALLDVLGDGQPQEAQSSNVQSAPNTGGKADSGSSSSPDVSDPNTFNLKQSQVPVAVSPQLAPQSGLSLVSQGPPASQRSTNQTVQSSMQPDKRATQPPSNSEPAQAVSIYTSIFPLQELNVGSSSIASEATSPQATATDSVAVSPKDLSGETVPVSAPALDPHISAAPSVPGQPLEQDSVVFEAHLQSQPAASAQTMPVNQTGPASPTAAPLPNQGVLAHPSNAAGTLIQSQGLQLSSPNPAVASVQSQGSQAAPSNAAVASVKGEGSPPSPSISSSAPVHSQDESVVPASSNAIAPSSTTVAPPNNTVASPSTTVASPSTNSSGNNSGSFEQGTKQDQNSSSPIEAKGEPPPVHVVAPSADAPISSQINPGNSNTQEASSRATAQPIAQQPAGPQPGVKTDMNLKVQGQSGENVTVRFSERLGTVQVTVRSTDPGTTTMLRHELPSIQAGLERAGWQMQGMTSHQSSSSQAGNGNNGQGSGQEKKNQSSGSESQEKQEKRNTSQQDQWFDLMEDKS